MPRYIDADALIAEYDRVHVGPAGGARKLMVEAPTADVAPKSEVAREIFAEIEKLLENQEVIAKSPREKELGDWIFHNYLPRKIAELKKKYTEDEK